MIKSNFYFIVLPFVALLFVTPLFTSCSQHTQQGAGSGAAAGAAAGALIDDDNTWRGAVNGGTPGAAFGGSIAEISNKAAGEAVEEGRPVLY
ncbi:MAG: YMGG-like glycine zipper-containing protein [Thermodesulfobacteriota bacterium]